MRHFLIILAMVFGSLALADDTDSIANITPDQTTIERRQVALFYTMRIRYWSDGTRITVYNLPADSRIHKDFVRSVLDMSPISYQQAIDRQVNAGVGGNFRTVDTETKMLDRVRSTYGAIGYVTKDYLIVSDNGGVRALKIVD